ncbi:MAG: hypothetical protein M5U08_24215 [Burkholderiales bacterium]|nr:hypothetical protein [Burkholderiales bacterium]
MYDSLLARAPGAIAAAAVLGALLVPPPALAADAAPGRALYEARCGGCHNQSVHNDTSRRARSLNEVRARVANFSAQLKTGWTAEEVDHVAVYLNERFYRFPCDPPLCERASSGTLLR